MQKSRTVEVLSALLNADQSATEIKEHINNATNGRIKIPLTGIYTQLDRMESAGLIRSYYGKATPAERRGNRRRYYAIKAAGRRVLDDLSAIQAFSTVA